MSWRALSSIAAGCVLAGTLAAAAPARPAPVFTDQAAATGLDFVHFNGMSGETYMIEIMGSGGALLDYDNDGDLDVYLVQGGPLGAGKPLHPPANSGPVTDRLYRNDLIQDGKRLGNLHFTDVTAQAGFTPGDYGQGIATGDFDNDGWVDVYRTSFGHDRLLRNTGSGGASRGQSKPIFEDVTAKAGVDDPRWSSSATFFDYDRDGWLDLFVVNYIDYTLAKHRPCMSEAGFVDYCGPLDYKPITSSLFHNRGNIQGNTTFEDVSARSGVGALASNGLGVVAADVDRDGWSDLYVANDAMPNHLFLNQKNGTFREDATLGGVAVSGEGKAQASMGVTAADFDGDEDDDLLVTNLTNEGVTIYVNGGGGLFNDDTPRSGLGPPSLPYTSFGTLDLDYDNDGWLDLAVVSGTVKKVESQWKAGDPLPLKQPNQLYHGLGRGRFEDASARSGDLARLNVGRGAAFGDVDEDGDTDLLVTTNAGPPQLLINNVGQGNRWLGVRLVGGAGGRDLLGARATLRLADGRLLARRVRTDGSYQSASDPRLLFGLGPAGGPAAGPAAVPAAVPAIIELRVTWPDGKRERWGAAAIAEGRYTTLRQGSGEPPPAKPEGTRP